MELKKTFDKLSMLAGLKTMIGGGKPNPVTNLMENPEDYKLEIYIEGDEIVMRVKKRKKAGIKPKMNPQFKQLPPAKTR